MNKTIQLSAEAVEMFATKWNVSDDVWEIEELIKACQAAAVMSDDEMVVNQPDDEMIINITLTKADALDLLMFLEDDNLCDDVVLDLLATQLAKQL